MSKKRAHSLKSISYRKAVAAFEKHGFMVVRQRGSHIVMSKPGHLYNVVVPAHAPLAEGTLKSCIKAAGITLEQFAAAL